MQVERRGDGDPELVIVAGMHGDEPGGPAAIHRLLADEPDWRRPVMFLIANEEALEQDERYLEADLNRVFPGDPDSDRHEERLAAAIDAAIGDRPLLDLHETRSDGTPFAIISESRGDVRQLVGATGVDRVADFSAIPGDSLTNGREGVVVECGPQGTQAAEEQAMQVLRNFLAAQGVIDGSFTTTDPVVYEVTEKVEKSGGWQFTGTNFQEITAGETYAITPDGPVTADAAFHPVLMSSDGYQDILGFRAIKHRSLSAHEADR